MTKSAGLVAVLGCAVFAGLLAAGTMPRAAGADEPRGAAAETAPPRTPPREKPFESIETKDLHNAYRVTDKIVSGAAPENQQAFEDLEALGVKTIVSVDGAQPDVEAAKRHGIRYVHLPIGYDDVTDDEGRRIAKALHELPGPIYLHCHHGRHRSAAAVAVACVMNGSLEPEQAESVLTTFGTGANYKGLWKSAREARPLDIGELGDINVEYVERAQIPELAGRMVELDKTWERLKAIRASGWRAPSDHPDLDPAHEALQLREHLHESGRAEDVAARPAEFRRLLTEGESGAAALRDALAADLPGRAAAAENAFTTVSQSCAACHKAYRD